MKLLKFPLFIIGGVIGAAWLVSLATPDYSDTRFAPNNHNPQGARAVAQVLKNNDVDITFTRELPEAVGHARSGATVLIAHDTGLSADQAHALLRSGADIVAANPRGDLVAAIAEHSSTSITQAASPSDITSTVAQCQSPVAQAAQEISSSGTGFTQTSPQAHVIECFPGLVGSHFAQVSTDEGQRIILFDDVDSWSNQRITDYGHAALALHSLGAHPQLVWFLPEVPELQNPAGLDGGPTMPQRFTIVAAVVLAAFVFLAYARMRRLGPLVSEGLPVVVKAAETTRGRARLYRGIGAYGRAAAALRAGTARRLAQRLGVPSSHDGEAFTHAVAHATGRPQQEIWGLFFGPSPATELSLTTLAQDLASLESEISI